MSRSTWLSFAFLAIGLVSAMDAQAASCSRERGAARANELVQQCLEVSPATHPPCNASNECTLIESEIVRGCGMLGEDKPSFCDDFPSDDE